MGCNRYSEKYFMYFHVDKTTGEVLYIGSGSEYWFTRSNGTRQKYDRAYHQDNSRKYSIKEMDVFKVYCSTREEAYRLEALNTSFYRLSGQCTYNVNTGKKLGYPINNKGTNNPNYGNRGAKSKLSITVFCIETGITYDGLREAERLIGISHQSISECCKGRQKTAGGYHWKYA